MKDLSIILPTYNTGWACLKRTIKCIINQEINLGIGDYKLTGELIIINDGSTDGSIEALLNSHIIDSFPDIKIINKANEGSSSARNCGLEIAQGQYVYFIDADDILTPNTLSVVLNECLKRDADVATFTFKTITEHSEEDTYDIDQIQPINELKTVGNFSLEQYMDKYVAMDGNTLWHILFKRSLIQNLRFNTDLILDEDYLFNFYAFTQAKNIISVTADKPMYYWVRHPNSLSFSLNLPKILKTKFTIYAYDKLLYDAAGMPQYYINAIKYRKTFNIARYIYGQIRFGCDVKSIWNSYLELRNDNILPSIRLSEIPLKARSKSSDLKIITLQHQILVILLLSISKLLKK